WHSTFENTNFTPKQRKLIGNVHIKYGCTDARDDYSAELRRKNAAADGKDGIMEINDTTQDADDNDDVKGDLPTYGIDGAIPLSELSVVSNAERRQRNTLDQNKQMLIQVGWIDKCSFPVSAVPSAIFASECPTKPLGW
ncbi:hypothetical protein FPV67DRAFT_1391897, partial [Lyophyllum atratum]